MFHCEYISESTLGEVSSSSFLAQLQSAPGSLIGNWSEMERDRG